MALANQTRDRAQAVRAVTMPPQAFYGFRRAIAIGVDYGDETKMSVQSPRIGRAAALQFNGHEQAMANMHAGPAVHYYVS
jgi:hypothetical protein